MDIHTDLPLSTYTTMRLGGPARAMVDVRSAEELPGILDHAAQASLRVAVLGSGSNTIAHDEGFDGLILRIKIPGIDIIHDDLYTTRIRVGAGEIWDDLVRFSVERHLSGIEAMSAIPGTVGAAPVQNIGAYGQEVAESLISLEAYDRQTSALVTLGRDDCGFSYRHSIFRGEASGRYIITSVTLELSKSPPIPPFYQALQRYLDEHTITHFTPDVIRQAVTEIRADKLPDPRQRPNAGSFFKNALIEDWRLPELLARYPDMPHFDMAGGRTKIPTGWLIETAGLRGQLLHGIRVHDRNALVLINESATSYADLARAREEIIQAVRTSFMIDIEQEPLELV